MYLQRVVGSSKAGKTAFLEKAVRGLKDRGYRVAVIKHDSHLFDIDHPGKDSWRMTEAGADVVAISSSEKAALIRKTTKEMPLDQLVEVVKDDTDIIMTEGYRGADMPKVEVHRYGVSDKVLCSENELLALVTDRHIDMDVPQFDFDNAGDIVNIIEEKFLSQPENEDIRLSVNGKNIRLNDFVKDALIKTVSGMVSNLHGAEDAREMKLTIRLP